MIFRFKNIMTVAFEGMLNSMLIEKLFFTKNKQEFNEIIKIISTSLIEKKDLIR